MGNRNLSKRTQVKYTCECERNLFVLAGHLICNMTGHWHLVSFVMFPVTASAGRKLRMKRMKEKAEKKARRRMERKGEEEEEKVQ